jgi:hypothetical protein
VRKRTKRPQTCWIGLPKGFHPLGYEGFCYLVVNTLTQRKYIGRKYFWKGRPRKKGRKESDWEYYRSSSDELRADIEELGIENFKFYILSLHKTRGECNYTEIKEQFSRDVLYSKLPSGEYEYYNGCIMHRFYRRT